VHFFRINIIFLLTKTNIHPIISGDMFVRIKKSGPREYLELVENRREGKKVRQRVLLNLGRVDFLKNTEAASKIVSALAKYSDEIAVISATKENKRSIAKESKQSVEWDKEWGASLVFRKLWRDMGMEKIIKSFQKRTRFGFDVEQAVFYTVLHRLLEPGSDLSASKWLVDIYNDEAGVDAPEIGYRHLLRAMGFIERFKTEIEEALFVENRLLFENSMDVVFFDTTSIYFEGDGPEGFAEYGLSKDHRPDRKQIVVAALMTRSGEPFCCEWWAGNMSDVKTIQDIVDSLKRRFSINRVVLVCDRGMVSKQNLAHLKANGIDYIVGVRLRLVKRVREDVLSRGGSYKKVSENLKVKEVSLGDERYIICLNPEEAARDAYSREKIAAELREKIKRSPKELVGNKGYRRYLKVEKDAVSVDEKRLKEETRFDGKFILTTNTGLSSEEVATTYKSLWQVEHAFRALKSVLGVRPIYHRSEAHVKGHVFCSYLALCLMVRLRKILAESGEEAQWDEVIRDLRALRAMKVRISGKSFLFRTELRGAASKVFRALGIKAPPSITKL